MNPNDLTGPIDLQAAYDAVAQEAYVEKLHPLGVCSSCPRPATTRSYDGEPMCGTCATRLARGILIQARAGRHCSTPKQKKARAKRRKARKAGRS